MRQVARARPGFYVRMNVALLKPGDAVRFAHLPRPFPRSDERGSIEAYASIEKGRGHVTTFPRSDERGSIEAPSVRAERRRWATFPRSDERGSIEAH